MSQSKNAFFSLIYVEKEISTHPKSLQLLQRYSHVPQVKIDRYGEVFNPQRQNFRLQKRAPALILANKYQNFVLKTPINYGIGKKQNYYFSHLMNCPFDCRYCFLQGMYSSAHFVFFVNQESFQQEVFKLDHPDATFFTGYDCDSLAFENVTGFVSEWLPVIAQFKGLFEFRTKSCVLRPFLEFLPLPNCVIAYTLSPHEIAKRFEHKAPSLEKRLQSMELLQEKGWKLGVRFDPVIEIEGSQSLYASLFQEVFQRISVSSIHSVSLGGFRVPPQLFKRMVALYPKEPLFAHESESSQDLLAFCVREILKYLPEDKLFKCYE